MNNQVAVTGNRLLPASLTDGHWYHTRTLRFGIYAGTGKTRGKFTVRSRARETIRRLMIKAGLWIPREQRAPKIHQPRYPAAMLLQRADTKLMAVTITGLRNGVVCTALVYVDDACSRLMHLLVA